MSANEPLPPRPEEQPHIPAPVKDVFSMPTEMTRAQAEPNAAPDEGPRPAAAATASEPLKLSVPGWIWVNDRWVKKPVPPHPNFWWALLWCIAFLIVTQVVPAVFAMVCLFVSLAASGGSLSHLSDTHKLQEMFQGPILQVVFFLQMTLSLAFGWMALRLMLGREWPRRIALRRPSLTHVGLALLSVPAFVLLANVAYEVLRKVLHMPSLSDLMGGHGQSMEDMVEIFGAWPWPLAVLLIGLGPGVTEELWCRGFLGQGLVGRYGVVLGIVFSSFFFGLIHVDPAQGTMAMLMGLWLHFTYVTTRSLWVPMLLHFTNNSLAVVASHFAATKEAAQQHGTQLLHTLNTSSLDMPAWIFVAAGLLLLAVAWALYSSRARLTAADGTEPAPWQPAYPGVEYPPSDSGTCVSHPLPSRAAVGLVVAALIAFVVCFVRWVVGS